MRTYCIITLVGRDEVGIVDQVTKIVLDQKGNVEESRMAHLGGEFAMLMLVSMDEVNTENLNKSIQSFKDKGYEVYVRETSEQTSDRFKGWLPFRIVVSGADHEGIIYTIAHDLAQKQINIESMDTNTTAAPMSGTLLFTMSAIIVVPPQLDYHEWRESLYKTADQVNVNIEVSPYQG